MFFSTARKRENMKQKLLSKKSLEWYSFFIVSLITILVLVYYPMLTTIKYSFYDVSVLGYGEKFTGFKNYELLLINSSFLNALLNTFILAFLGLSSIPLGFLLAYLINSLGRGKLQGFFRVGFYLPNIITGVSVVMILQVVFKSNDGLFNNFLSAILHQDITIGWLSDAKYAKIGATLIHLWSNLGYSMLINLASMQSIPEEIYDAARVDGANAIQKCLYITIPNMKNCFLFLFITGMISGLARFTDLFILGGNNASGVPAGSLQTIMMYIYQYSFEKLEYGISSAGSMVMFGVTFIFTMISAKLTGFFNDERY